jgi:hypothetical protein
MSPSGSQVRRNSSQRIGQKAGRFLQRGEKYK